MAEKRDIAILGVMGSGKSTIGKMLSEELGYKFYEESFETCSILSKYYGNPAKYAFELECWFMREKAWQHIEIGRYEGCTVQDSPIQSTVGAFIPAMHDLGILKDREFDLLNDLYNDFIAKTIPRPTQFVYLKVSPSVLLDRVKRRDRDFERVCDLEYLESSANAMNGLVNFCTGERYNDFLQPLIVVDGDGTPDEIVKEIVGKL